MKELIETLHKGAYSCVISNQGTVRTFTQRGVADLYDLYEHQRTFLQGAQVADKVIGKGAAALMALGQVQEVYGDIISTHALSVLRSAGIRVSYGKEVPYIINRAGTGQCPLETLCRPYNHPEDMYPVIQEFVLKVRQSVPAGGK